MKNYKIIALMLALLMIIGVFAGCNKNTPSDDPSETGDPVQPTPAVVTADDVLQKMVDKFKEDFNDFSDIDIQKVFEQVTVEVVLSGYDQIPNPTTGEKEVPIQSMKFFANKNGKLIVQFPDVKPIGLDFNQIPAKFADSIFGTKGENLFDLDEEDEKQLTDALQQLLDTLKKPTEIKVDFGKELVENAMISYKPMEGETKTFNGSGVKLTMSKKAFRDTFAGYAEKLSALIPGFGATEDLADIDEKYKDEDVVCTFLAIVDDDGRLKAAQVTAAESEDVVYLVYEVTGKNCKLTMDTSESVTTFTKEVDNDTVAYEIKQREMCFDWDSDGDTKIPKDTEDVRLEIDKKTRTFKFFTFDDEEPYTLLEQMQGPYEISLTGVKLTLFGPLGSGNPIYVNFNVTAENVEYLDLLTCTEDDFIELSEALEEFISQWFGGDSIEDWEVDENGNPVDNFSDDIVG